MIGRCLAVAALTVLGAQPVLAQFAEPIPRRQGPLAQPAKPAAPRQAMVPCPEFGPGFMRTPGASTCIRVEGRVRGEMQFRQRGSQLDETFGSSAQMRLGLDVRAPTDAGPFRAVAGIRGQTGSFDPRGAR
jgi:hypothetical protein